MSFGLSPNMWIKRFAGFALLPGTDGGSIVEDEALDKGRADNRADRRQN